MKYMNKKKVGLVLGAGGARGIAHVGFLKALEENGIMPDCISGSSAGAIVGACMGFGISSEVMIEEIRNLKTADIVPGLPNFSRGGLYRTRGVHRKLNSFFGRKRISDMNLEYCCVATDLAEGKEKIFGGRSFVVPAVTASSCIPALFEPEVIGGVQYIDGGIVSRVPIGAIRRFEPDVVIAVDVFACGPSKKEYSNVLSVFARAIDIMDRGYTDAKTEDEKPDLLIQPNLGSMSQYALKGIDFAYEQGYKAAVENMDKIKELIS